MKPQDMLWKVIVELEDDKWSPSSELVAALIAIARSTNGDLARSVLKAFGFVRATR